MKTYLMQIENGTATLTGHPGESMIMLNRLIRLIETHSRALTKGLIDRVQASYATPDYKNVPRDELQRCVSAIYRHLGEWLLTKDELDLERRYLRIGAERANQKVPFSQVAWVIEMVKDNLWEFLKREFPRPVEPSGELEMLQLLDHFFERALYYAALGYELHCCKPERAAA